MPKIEIGRFSELLRRALGMKGTQEVSGELSPELSPVWVLENPTEEWLFLKSVRGCRFGDALSAGIGFTAKWRMRNPLASGIIAVVEALEVTPLAAANFVVSGNAQTVDFPTPVVGSIPDGRWGPILTANPAVIVTASNAQATGPAGEVFAQARRAADQPFLYERPVVLIPGAVLDFGTSSTNIGAHAWCTWTERQIPALEL